MPIKLIFIASRGDRFFEFLILAFQFKHEYSYILCHQNTNISKSTYVNKI